MSKKEIKYIEDGRVGFNMETQMLRCLVLLNDDVGKAMSERAGEAFFRAFIVEDRKTGEVFVKQRFRYMDEDCWYQMRPGPEIAGLSREDQAKRLAEGISKVMRQACAMMAGGVNVRVPEDVIVCFYPPEPEDSQKTFEWLIAQDLIEIKGMFREDGTEIPISREAKA